MKQRKSYLSLVPVGWRLRLDADRAVSALAARARQNWTYALTLPACSVPPKARTSTVLRYQTLFRFRIR